MSSRIDPTVVYTIVALWLLQYERIFVILRLKKRIQYAVRNAYSTVMVNTPFQRIMHPAYFLRS